MKVRNCKGLCNSRLVGKQRNSKQLRKKEVLLRMRSGCKPVSENDGIDRAQGAATLNRLVAARFAPHLGYRTSSLNCQHSVQFIDNSRHFSCSQNRCRLPHICLI